MICKLCQTSQRIMYRIGEKCAARDNYFPVPDKEKPRLVKGEIVCSLCCDEYTFFNRDGNFIHLEKI